MTGMVLAPRTLEFKEAVRLVLAGKEKPRRAALAAARITFRKKHSTSIKEL